MVNEVAALTGDIYINPTQGSWSGAAASAGTHTGCGAVDLMHPSWSVADYDTVVREMRRVGFAAWHRTPQQSNWPRHVHGIAVQKGGMRDKGCLSDGAFAQVLAYEQNRNGLASGGRDDGPRQFVGTTWETYQEEDMPLTDKDIEKIAEATAKAVNQVLGDYNSKGNPVGPNADKPQYGATYIRQIKNISQKVLGEVKE